MKKSKRTKIPLQTPLKSLRTKEPLKQGDNLISKTGIKAIIVDIGKRHVLTRKKLFQIFTKKNVDEFGILLPGTLLNRIWTRKDMDKAQIVFLKEKELIKEAHKQKEEYRKGTEK